MYPKKHTFSGVELEFITLVWSRIKKATTFKGS